jgi:hypothetical protein
MSKQTDALAKALAELDGSNLENLESVDGLMEALENVDEKSRKVIMKHVLAGKTPGSRTFLDTPDTRKGKIASVTVRITRTITKGNAILVDGSGTPVVLPAPIFGVLEYESNYSRVLSKFLPQDGSVKVKSFAKTSDSQSLIITFQNGDDSINETVTIIGTNTVWTNLLRGLSSSLFEVVNPKMIIGDVLRINQFDQPLNIFLGSMFTKTDTDNISPQDYKPEALSDNTVRILRDTVPVNPEKTLVPGIVPSTVTNLNGSSFYYTLTLPLGNIRKDA